MSITWPSHCPHCQALLVSSPIRCDQCHRWTLDGTLPPELALAIGVDFLQLELAATEQEVTASQTSTEPLEQRILARLLERLQLHRSAVQQATQKHQPPPLAVPLESPLERTLERTLESPLEGTLGDSVKNPLVASPETSLPLSPPNFESPASLKREPAFSRKPPVAASRPHRPIESAPNLLFSLEDSAHPSSTVVQEGHSTRPEPLAAIEPTIPPPAPADGPRPERFQLSVESQASASDLDWKRLRPLVAENLLWFIGAFMTLVGAFYFASTHWTGLSRLLQSVAILTLILTGAGSLGGLALFLSRQPGLSMAGRVLATLGMGLLPATVIPLNSLNKLSPLAMGAGLAGVVLVARMLLPRLAPLVSQTQGRSWQASYLVLSLMPVLLPFLKMADAEPLLLWLPIPQMVYALWRHNTSEGKQRVDQVFALGMIVYAGSLPILWARDTASTAHLVPIGVLAGLGGLYLDLALSHWKGVTRLYLSRLPALLGLGLILLSLAAAVLMRAQGTTVVGPALALMLGTMGLGMLGLLWRERQLFRLTVVASVLSWVALPDLFGPLADLLLGWARIGLGYADAPLPLSWYVFTLAPYLLLGTIASQKLEAIERHREAADTRHWLSLLAVLPGCIAVGESMDGRPALFGLPLLIALLYRLFRLKSEPLPLWLAQGLLVGWTYRLLSELNAPVSMQGLALVGLGLFFFQVSRKPGHRAMPHILAEIWGRSAVAMVALAEVLEVATALTSLDVSQSRWFSVAGLLGAGLAGLAVSVQLLSPWGVLLSIPVIGLGFDQVRMALGIVSNPLFLPWIALGVSLLAWFWPRVPVKGSHYPLDQEGKPLLLDWLQSAPLPAFRPFETQNPVAVTEEAPPAGPREGLISGPLWLLARVAVLGALAVVSIRRYTFLHSPGPDLDASTVWLEVIRLLIPSIPLLTGLGLMLTDMSRLVIDAGSSAPSHQGAQRMLESRSKLARLFALFMTAEVFYAGLLPGWHSTSVPEAAGAAVVGGILALLYLLLAPALRQSPLWELPRLPVLMATWGVQVMVLPELMGEGPYRMAPWLYPLVAMNGVTLALLLRDRLAVLMTATILHSVTAHWVLRQPSSAAGYNPLDVFFCATLSPVLLYAGLKLALESETVRQRFARYSARLTLHLTGQDAEASGLAHPSVQRLKTFPDVSLQGYGLLGAAVAAPLVWLGRLLAAAGLVMSLSTQSLMPDLSTTPLSHPSILTFTLSAAAGLLLLNPVARQEALFVLPAMLARALDWSGDWCMGLLATGWMAQALFAQWRLTRARRSTHPAARQAQDARFGGMRQRAQLLSLLTLPLTIVWDRSLHAHTSDAVLGLQWLLTPVYALELLTIGLTARLTLGQTGEALVTRDFRARVWLWVGSWQLALVTVLAGSLALAAGMEVLSHPTAWMPQTLLLLSVTGLGLELWLRRRTTSEQALAVNRDIDSLLPPQSALILLLASGIETVPRLLPPGNVYVLLAVALASLGSLLRGVRLRDALDFRLGLMGLGVLGLGVRLQTELGRDLAGYEAMGVLWSTLLPMLLLEWLRHRAPQEVPVVVSAAGGEPDAHSPEPKAYFMLAPLRELVVVLPLFSLFLAGAVIPALTRQPPEQLSAALVALAGLFYLGLHVLERRPWSLIMGAILFNLATVAKLVSMGAVNLMLYGALPGMTLIGMAHHYRTRLSRSALNVLRYGGLSLIYSASYVETWSEPLNNLILVLLCLAGIGWGLWTRVRSFLHLGAGVLVLTILTSLIKFGLAHPQFNALYLILLGVSILASMVVFTWKRQQLQAISTNLQSRLEGWE